MRRPAVWVPGIALAALLGAELRAQEMVSAQAPRFTIGLYGGGAYTTDWFESRRATSTGGVPTVADEGVGYRIGFAPIFGAATTLYLSPMLGVRLHGAYMPSGLPEPGDDSFEEGTGDDASYPQNNWFYDLSLVLRPWAMRSGGALAQTYLFLGGGGLTTNIAGSSPDPDGPAFCDGVLLAQGACLPIEPEPATVGQGTAGIGVDLLSLAANIGVFAELATHIYDSPVHTGDNFVPRIVVQPGQPFQVADDRIATTTRLVAGLKVGFGGFGPAIAPPLPPAPPPPPSPPPPPPPAERAIRVCVVQGNALVDVDAMFNPTTGDTVVVVQGVRRPFAQAFPAVAPAYAAGATWFINNDEIQFNNRPFVKFGVTRVIAPNQLTRVGEVNGVGVFAETGATAPYNVVYVPVRPGCEFQPYQARGGITPRG